MRYVRQVLNAWASIRRHKSGEDRVVTSDYTYVSPNEGAPCLGSDLAWVTQYP